jgi:hypothetical protein
MVLFFALEKMLELVLHMCGSLLQTGIKESYT